MKKLNKWITDNLVVIILAGVSLICAIFLFCGTRAEDGTVTLDGKPAVIEEYTEKFIEDANDAMESTIIYSDEKIPAIIVTENGEEYIDAPTIDYIDGHESPDDDLKAEDAKGTYHNTDTYLDYYKSVGIGNCITNNFGAQCFALANDFWQNYAGRALSSCGTGAAKGTLNCYDYNAGDDFVMIWDAKQLQPGDWVVLKSGTWGHIGMAMGYYNNGYISLFGQNQGGGYCSGGGAATNVVNVNLASFGGAFRPKSYIVPEPRPEPIPEPVAHCDKINIAKGDTMGSIMKRCKGIIIWGAAMDEYASHWYSTIYKPNRSVLDGWKSQTGVGLYAGDVIEWRK